MRTKSSTPRNRHFTLWPKYLGEPLRLHLLLPDVGHLLFYLLDLISLAASLVIRDLGFELGDLLGTLLAQLELDFLLLLRHVVCWGCAAAATRMNEGGWCLSKVSLDCEAP
uniref:Uncharacterized protein n=1 Tax=Pseudictyota dubia TaxID=2749911 RepID=A0A7R9VFU5_9STRA